MDIRKLYSLTIDVETGAFLVNGEPLKGVREFAVEFKNGSWYVWVLQDVFYEQNPEELKGDLP